MPVCYRPYQPKQTLLFPADMADALPKNHLVFFLQDVVAKLDLSPIHAAYEGRKGGRRSWSRCLARSRVALVFVDFHFAVSPLLVKSGRLYVRCITF